jgi:hypothetical protein
MIRSHDRLEPIFILSCERSGSTLLRMIVDTHPDIACPGQLALGPTCARLYEMIYYSLGQRVQGSESERVAEVLKEVRSVVAGVMERYASARDKSIWCEKSTLNVDYLKILSRVFPNARYLWLYRNCMDVVQSCLDFSAFGFMDELAPYVRKDPRNLVGAMAENWLDKNQKIFELETTNPSRCFRIGYENLTRDPNVALPPVFRFLGVSWEPEIVTKIFSSEHDRGEGDTKANFSKQISTESIGKGRSIPSSALPDHLRRRIDDMNRCLGLESLETFYKKQDEVAGTDRLDLDRFFRSQLPQMIAERRKTIGNLRAVCQILVEGEGGGSWTIDRSGAEGVIRKEREISSADCVISINYSAFCALVEGKASVGEIHERRQVKVRGSQRLAIQFGMLVFG